MLLHGYRNPRWFIDLPGAAVEGFSKMVIDGAYCLIPVHPTYSVGVAPRAAAPHPRLDEIVFYANCLAFDYDVPTFVWGVGALVVPVERTPSGHEREAYRRNMLVAYEAMTDIRFGLAARVELPVWGPADTVDLPYTARYAGTAHEISLYASAIRQPDPLSEFLSYYRVIERAAGRDHKSWIATNLARMAEHDFGFLELGHVDWARRRRRRNLFSIYRRRALGRLRQLAVHLPQGEMADYFYNRVRCGIAHGSTGIKVYDFADDVTATARDCYVLKLLARMAVEGNLRPVRRRR